ncbi:hypothetical protein GN157_16910 [Flavobacterium rakeshii]|uniref:Uncharacterized protein n=1 Tax=Flavobacterium rakeshii TaxID=1038845 RepID=A0A6N8HIB6_9FLAO|nr:hypothetical protein [Flavobacterium rakeshii]MUV05396.1 hypothetical protein [Flavobacterium rakeshii]
MLKENLSPKQILVDLSSVQCQLKDLFSDDNRYNSIIDFLSAKDYYNDPDVPYPTMKEVEKDTGLSASQLRKKLLEMYERIFDFENDEGLRFSKTQYTFYLKHYELHSQFVVSKLPHVPRAGEQILLPFAKAKMGTEYFYVDKIVHYLENDIQNTVIWLKGGFYNSYWQIRKDEALLKRELTIDDTHKLMDFELKDKLGLSKY